MTLLRSYDAWKMVVAGLIVSIGTLDVAPAQVSVRDANRMPGEHVWEAKWIAHPEVPRTAYGVFHFRRSFALDQQPPTFSVHVSADNRYRLFVNGRPVAHGPARGDVMHWRYETVDLAPFLRPGRNVLAAVVWNFADHRPQAQFTYETGFILQGATDRESVVNTDSTWKVIHNEAYAPVPVDREELDWTYIVVGPGERVDAHRYPWGWEQVDFNDDGWTRAREVHEAVRHRGPYGIAEGWRLVPRTIPPMEESEQRIPHIARAVGVEVHPGFLSGGEPLVVPEHTTATVLLDQTHLTTAYPELIVSGGAGSRVTLTYAEALFDEQGRKGNRNAIAGKEIRGYRDVFLPDGGDARLFRPLWWRTYRYVQLDIETGEAPLRIDDLRGVFTAYPFEERAYFASSDTTLRAIWRAGWRTARLCAGETYFDCPYYEQLQYVGDTRIQALISLYVAGDDRLMRKAIQTFADSRFPSGLTQSRYPAWETQFIPPYSLFWIAMVHDYWMHRQDAEFVRPFLTPIREVVEWFEAHVDSTGMLGPMPWWNFVDWSYERAGVPPGAEEGQSSVITLQFVYALQYAARLADAFGRSDEALHFRTLAGSLLSATYRLCWDASRGLLADTPAKEVFSQHANVMAVLVDLVPPGEQEALMRRVLSEPDLVPCTYYYRFYLDRAMKKAGLGHTYVDRLGPWREMLDLGLTTFAESPEPTRSDAHAWSAGPNYHLLATVCGIEPASPGFRTVRIAPALGPLAWVEGHMPHPQGEIRVALRRKAGGGIRGEVTLPSGVSGTFVWNDQAILLEEGTQMVDL